VSSKIHRIRYNQQLSQVGLASCAHPLGNNNQFHGVAPNSKVSGLTWRDQWLIQQVDGRMIVLSDTGFHATEGDPSNLKVCQRGEWQDRMLVETVLSMLTLICHFKKVMHRVWASFHTRRAFTMAVFNILVQWHGFQPHASGFVPLSMAEFSL
jgi:hypothetical protein